MRTGGSDAPVGRDINSVRMEHLAMVTNHLSSSTVFFFSKSHFERDNFELTGEYSVKSSLS